MIWRLRPWYDDMKTSTGQLPTNDNQCFFPSKTFWCPWNFSIFKSSRSLFCDSGIFSRNFTGILRYTCKISVLTDTWFFCGFSRTLFPKSSRAPKSFTGKKTLMIIFPFAILCRKCYTYWRYARWVPALSATPSTQKNAGGRVEHKRLSKDCLNFN